MSVAVPSVSVAVTLTLIVPTSEVVGVPKNLLLTGKNVSHAGNALPSACVADKVIVSPALAMNVLVDVVARLACVTVN